MTQSNKINRIILTGGGTGGHIYPALSIYERLKELNPNLEVLYIGTKRGLESEIVPAKGLKFETIEIEGFKRSLSLDNLKSIWLMLKSTHKSRQIIKDFNPDVVVGTGGYVCGPVMLAAALEKYHTLIHEQNSIAGLTNRFLSRFVDRICISFEAARSGFSNVPEKVVLTGNPRGQEVVQIKGDENILKDQFNLDPKKKTVLIFGGSRGAPAINEAAVGAVDKFKDLNVQVIIATGRDHYERIKANLESLPDNVRLVPYIEDMPKLFSSLDLIVCRSGATTLTEITALGIPSILIPSPYVTDNHQEHNGQALVDQGASRMIKEENLTSQVLFDEVASLITNENQLKKMAHAARSMGITNATDLIIQELNKML